MGPARPPAGADRSVRVLHVSGRHRRLTVVCDPWYATVPSVSEAVLGTDEGRPPDAVQAAARAAVRSLLQAEIVIEALRRCAPTTSDQLRAVEALTAVGHALNDVRALVHAAFDCDRGEPGH